MNTRRNVSGDTKRVVDAVIRDLQEQGRSQEAAWLSLSVNRQWAYLFVHQLQRNLPAADPWARMQGTQRFITHYAEAQFADITENTLNAVDQTGATDRGIPAYPVNTVVQGENGLDYIVIDVRGNGVLTLCPLQGSAAKALQGYSHLIEDPESLGIPSHALSVIVSSDQTLRFAGPALRKLYESADTLQRYIIQPVLQEGESDPYAVLALFRERGIAHGAPLPLYTLQY